MEKLPPRHFLRVRYRTPDKVLESCDPGRSVHDGFSLHDLRGCGLRLPKVCQGVDGVRAFEGSCESIRTVVNVSAEDLSTSRGERLRGRFGRVAS